MSCNCTPEQKCGCGLTFKIDGSFLVPYVGGAPLEPVDLSDVLVNSETETRLQLDSVQKELTYTGERATSGDGIADVITIESIANLINLGDLANVQHSTPNDGDMLIYDAAISNWKPYTVSADVLVTAIGFDSNGDLKKQDVTALTQIPIDNSPRVNNQASVATLTFDVANFDQFNLTAQAETLTIASPGATSDAQRVIIRIKDNGTPRAINWNSIFRFIGVTQPTTTVANKCLYIGARYNTQDSKWDVLAIGRE